MSGPGDDPEEPLPPVPEPPATRGRRLLGLVLEPARNAEVIIAVAYVMALVGLALPILSGLEGSVTVLGLSVGLLFLSFLALFYCTLVITTAGGGSGERSDR